MQPERESVRNPNRNCIRIEHPYPIGDTHEALVQDYSGGLAERYTGSPSQASRV